LLAGFLRYSLPLDYADLPNPIENWEDVIAKQEETVDLLQSEVKELLSLEGGALWPEKRGFVSGIHIPLNRLSRYQNGSFEKRAKQPFFIKLLSGY
jgi:hypothetical protein